MSKKLLAMAVAAAVLAPAAASADAKLYGIVQAEYNVEDVDGTGQDSQQAVDDDGNRSRLGVKFSEKLGGGLTAFGKLEWSFDPSNGQGSSGAASAGAFGSRDQFVGIKSSWGAISAGSHHAPYKTAGGVKWDPWTATHLQARRAGGMSGGTGIGGHNGFMRNSIYYTSPKVNGFLVQFAISPDETNSGANNGSGNGIDSTDDGDNDYSIALQYKNGPWHALVAHNRNNVGSNDGNGDDETLSKVGLRWKSGPWTLAGQYEVIDDGQASAGGNNVGGRSRFAGCNGCDSDILWLNAQYKAGNNIFTVSYGNTDVDVPSGGSGGAVDDYDHNYFAIGVIHKFSKKTRIFAGYTETDGDDDAPGASGMRQSGQEDRDAFTVGIRKDF